MSKEKSISPVSGDNMPALAAVLEFQPKLFAAQSEVTRLERAIQAQKDSVEALKRSEPDLSTLDATREALLARIAIGEAGREELSALDQEQEAARVEAATQKVRAELRERECSQAVSGLTKLLGVARQRLAELAGQQPKLVDVLIQEEQQSIYFQYLAAVAQARDAWIRLYGLARLSGKSQHVDQFCGMASKDLNLPLLRHLQSPETSVVGEGHAYPPFRELFYSFDLHKRFSPEIHINLAKAEAEALRAKGVKLQLNF